MIPPKVAGIFIISLLLIALAGSCSQAPRESKAPVTFQEGVPAPKAAVAPQDISSAGSSSQDVPSVQQRMTVRTISVSILVQKVKEAADQIAEMTVRLGGFVVSLEINQEDEERARMSIRIPVEKTDEAVKSLRGLATRVLEEKQNQQDITEEFTDLQARLRNLQATEAKYLDLLQAAKTVQDTIQVQRELSNVREQIERLQGRIQSLERRSATSLITIILEPSVSQKPVVRQGWDFVEIIKGAARGFVVALQVLGVIAVWVILFIPIWGTILAVTIYLRRRKRRKAANPKSGG